MTSTGLRDESEQDEGRMPGVLRLGLTQTGAELREFVRRWDSMVFIFFFPVVLLAIFGSIFDDDVVPGVSYTQYFAAGMLASGIVMSSFQSLAISIAVARDNEGLKRLRGTPLPAVSYFLGKIGQSLVTGVLQSVVLLVLGALLFGLDLPTDAMIWVRFAWIFVLGTASGTVLGIAYSSVPRSAESAVSVVAPVVIVLMFISGVYFVFTDLPDWMQTLGSVFPLKWLAQGMRSVFLPDSFASAEASGSWQLPETALVLAGWTVVGLLLSLWTFRWQPAQRG